jgi:hypothetical protein
MPRSVGYSARHSGFGGVGPAELVSGMSMAGPIRPAPVQRVAIEVGDGRVVRCVTMGMYLARRDRAPLALVISRGERPWGGSALKLEGASPEPDAIPALLGDLHAAMREHDVYRSKVISLLGQPADGAAPGTPVGPTFGPMVHAIGAAGLPLPPGVRSE